MSVEVHPPSALASRPSQGAWIETRCTRQWPSLCWCRALHRARGLKPRVARDGVLARMSRPSQGAWIETGRGSRWRTCAESRPSQGAWIETRPVAYWITHRPSRPSQGAWIETTAAAPRSASTARRALHRARGLKQAAKREGGRRQRSRPSQGAWIETIEGTRSRRRQARRALHRARGLKHCRRTLCPDFARVAPFTGRVD